MNRLKDVEAKLTASLPVHSVGKLEGFPYATYSEFLDDYRKGKVIVKAVYDLKALNKLATKGEFLVNFILASGAFIVMVLGLILSLALRNWWLLGVIPVAGLGYIFGVVPLPMKLFGNKLFFLTAVIFLIALFNNNFTTSCLAGGYCISNGLTVLTRHQCAWILRRGALQSEFVLIALYLERKILIRPA
jgi:hypothetical protein